jgi:PAT family beta-lactamase induction signal transducer AmpG
MLAEYGFKPTTISVLLLATLPYSFKFAISPFVKNIIFKSNGNITKKQAFICQFIIIVGMSLFGIYTRDSSPILMFINMLIVVLAGSVHDLLGDYIRLVNFKDKTLGIATSVGTVGFRIGMLISGAGILYLASFFGWKYAFAIASLSILISTFSTIFLSQYEMPKESTNSLKQYLSFCINLFKKHNIILIILLTLSFKFADSTINGLKTVFLHSNGIGKIDFANISQVTGVLITLIVGTVSGAVTYKYDIKKCMKAAFILQIIPAMCFLHIAVFGNNSFLLTATLINISTFFLGFSSVIYRVYISEISEADINTYTILLSIGSMFRSLSVCLGGIIVDEFSWTALYIICILANIPGLVVCYFWRWNRV